MDTSRASAPPSIATQSTLTAERLIVPVDASRESERVLRGKALSEQVGTLLSVESPRSAVVLSNPLKLFGPLRELTMEFWANPHRLTYIAGW
jgi:hypothetical protein